MVMKVELMLKVHGLWITIHESQLKCHY